MRALVLSSLLLVWTASPALAQTRPAFFDTPSTVIAVGHPVAGQRYPLLVASPPTGLGADWLFEGIRGSVPLETYFVMLTPGAPARSDYLPRFGDYLGWFDARVMPDLDAALAAHPIDPEQVYAVGFSLGGDVSWALVARHPDRFRGALVMGSRSTASAVRGASATLQRRGARIAFVIGDADDPGRRRGIERAYAWAQRASLTTQLFVFSGQHELAPPDVLRAAMQRMLGPSAH